MLPLSDDDTRAIAAILSDRDYARLSDDERIAYVARFHADLLRKRLATESLLASSTRPWLTTESIREGA